MSSFPNVQSQSFVSATTYVSARTYVSAANVDAGNITATRSINAGSANITGRYFFGNGSQLTGIASSSYANSNVAAYLPTYTGALTGSTVSASGNVTGAYFVGNGSQLTGISTGGTSYTNANVAAYLPTYTGALAGSNIVVTGNATGGNILTAGVVSATGAVFGSVFVGNGSQLSGINAGTAGTAGTVTTAAQPNITSVGTLTSLVVSSNITGGNITTAGTISTTGTVIGDSVVATNLNVGNAVSISGNLQANYLRTTGSISAAGNIAAQNLAITGAFAPATISASGNVFAGNIATAGYISAAGVVIGSMINSPNVIATNLTVGNINGTPYIATSGPAFIATITNGQSLPVSPLSITQYPLVYNSVSKNISNGYQVSGTNAGKFIAPVAGYYQISACAGGFPPLSIIPSTAYYGSALIGIYKNGSPVASGPFQELKILTGVGWAISSSSISTLVYLAVGDQLQCILAYVTNITGCTTLSSIVPQYFQGCWLRA